jgi:hypothetical protein
MGDEGSGDGDVVSGPIHNPITDNGSHVTTVRAMQ